MAQEEPAEQTPLVQGEANPEKKNQASKPPRLFPSFRLLICLLATAGEWVTAQSQTSMGAAMVCMVTNGSRDATSSEFETFDWDKRTQGWVLAVRFMAYYFSQLPSGYLKSCMSNRVMAVTGLVVMGTSDVMTVPGALYGSVGLLYFIRIIQGVGNALLSTACWDTCGKWFPSQESSFLNSIYGTGYFAGVLAVFVVSSFLCNTPHLGWPSIFYFSGILGLVLAVLWGVFVDEDPSVSRWASQEEIDYIVQSKAGDTLHGTIPLKAMLRSGPLYAVSILQLAGDWVNFFAFTVAPGFFTTVILLPQSQSELVCGLPFIVMVPLATVFGRWLDHLRLKGTLSTVNVRRLAGGIVCLGSAACCLLLAWLPASEKWAMVIVYVFFLLTFAGQPSSWMANIQDLAPQLAGPTAAVSQTLAVWTTFVVPLLVNYITVDNSKGQWNTVFYVTAGVQLLCFGVFCCLASGEVQPWALDEDTAEGPPRKQYRPLSTKESLQDDSTEDTSSSKTIGTCRPTP